MNFDFIIIAKSASLCDGNSDNMINAQFNLCDHRTDLESNKSSFC